MTTDGSDESDGGAAGVSATGWSKIGMEIAALRRKLGWSQSELARAIGYAPSQVSRWEAGQAAPPRRAARAILEAVLAEEGARAQLVAEMREARRGAAAGTTLGLTSRVGAPRSSPVQ